MNRFMKIVLIGIGCLLISFLSGQENDENLKLLRKDAPKVFLDCPRCDVQYIKTEITFVNYVWDRKEADIHVLVTTQRTGSGGREYTVAFIGQNDFSDFQNTLIFNAHRTSTDDEIRNGLVRTMKIGLVSAAARTPIKDKLSVSFDAKVDATDVDDPWNFWVFSIGGHGFLSGQKAYHSFYLSGDISANRVTPESKLRMSVYVSYDENRYDVDGETISSSSESQGLNGMYVKSISDHWSIGAYISVYRSTYRNTDLAVVPSPAVEFNIFPYSESTRHQLRFLYLIGYKHVDYIEKTIYDKTRENLWFHSLSLTLELNEPWGTIATSIKGTNYLHDFSKNNFQIYCDLSLRLFKGLRLNLYGSYSQIHDQLSLPKGGATIQEVLLRIRELETSFRYFASIGLSYSFGSIYSNVVNPRFGNHRHR